MNKIKNLLRRKYFFGITFTIFLLMAGGFILLDTFVIPKAMTPAVATSTTSSSSDASTAAATGNSETDSNTASDSPEINITETRVDDTTVYVVDVKLSSISQLKTAFANDTYGLNIKETTSDMAENNDAILAINGDYYGFRNSGYVLRNGQLYRDTSANGEDLAIMSDGSFQIIDESQTSASTLLNQGALQVFSFGPALVENSQVVVSENTEVDQAMTSNPRTAIGIIEPLHYVIVVSDGRTDESEGLTLYQLAQVLQEQGCETAYNLDGGGSTTLWYNGEVINNPTSGHGIKEREVSDIIYITN